MIPVLDELSQALGTRYRLHEELGRGGAAVVYRATDVRHERDVALKILRPEISALLGTQRFLREIRITARLAHPHILPLLDSGTVPADAPHGRPYYVMPFVQGESLRARLRREPRLAVAEAVRLAAQVADALAYAHRQGVVHRDIKPENILLEAEHAVVADFGIAHALDRATAERITESGLAVGTPHYISPEQATGAAVDGRSDVYSLGCVLFEMLAGGPPYAGETPQSVVARHLAAPVPDIRAVRDDVPEAVAAAIASALAKRPEDRFPTATAFAAALAPDSAPTRFRPRMRRAAVVAGVALAAAGAAVWLGTRREAAPTDGAVRIAVFPLREVGTGVDPGSGEGVATYIGHALERTDPLRWIEPPGDAGARGLSRTRMRALARERGATYFIDGSLTRDADSARVILRLFDAAGDSILGRAVASGPPATASFPQLGLRAVGELLPALLEPGRRVDLAPLADRAPAAITHFLQGERDYRRTRFADALVHYTAAVAADSSLAVAALKGAQAANWLERSDEAELLVRTALERDSLLPPRHAALARGLLAYFTGRADRAVDELQKAVAAEPRWSEAWMALGEVYYHLLPDTAPLGELAEAAFERARADSGFAPPLVHLTEIAVRRGDLVRAGSLLAAFERVNPDSSLRRHLRIMHRCVDAGPDAVGWDTVVARTSDEAIEAAKALSGGGAQLRCAAAGFEAVLRRPAAEPHERWGAIVSLAVIYSAQDRTADVVRLLDSPDASAMSAGLLYLPLAAAGVPVQAQAESVAAAVGETYDSLSTSRLWALGEWHANRRDAEPLRAIEATLRRRADSGGTRVDSLVADAMAAHLALLDGDTAAALERFRTLRPTAAGNELAWQPWEALGAERIAEARLLVATGRADEAEAVLSALTSPQPLAYIVYLRAARGLTPRPVGLAARRP